MQRSSTRKSHGEAASISRPQSEGTGGGGPLAYAPNCASGKGTYAALGAHASPFLTVQVDTQVRTHPQYVTTRERRSRGPPRPVKVVGLAHSVRSVVSHW